MLKRTRRREVRLFFRGRLDEHRKNGMEAEEAYEAAFADAAEKFEGDVDWDEILDFLIRLAEILVVLI